MNFGAAQNLKTQLNYTVEVDTSTFTGITFSLKLPNGMRIAFESQIDDGPWLPLPFINISTSQEASLTTDSANYRGDVSRFTKIRFRVDRVFDVAGTVIGTVFNVVNEVDVTNTVTVDGPLTNAELRSSPVPVSGAITATISGVSTEAKQDSQITAANLTNTEIGATNEAAAATDTATSGLNGLLKRLLQRITTLLSVLPSSLGAKVSASSLSVVPASDATFPVSGTVTANTGLTQPLTNAELRASPVPVSVSSTTPSKYSSSAFEASGVIKASAGTLYGLMGFNNSGADQYLLLFNAAAVPANGAAPSVTPLKIQAVSNFFISINRELTFSTGICFSNSSTAGTKTIGAADIWVTALYI